MFRKISIKKTTAVIFGQKTGNPQYVKEKCKSTINTWRDSLLNLQHHNKQRMAQSCILRLLNKVEWKKIKIYIYIYIANVTILIR